MRYFSKAGNVKTKTSRIYADLSQGLSFKQEGKKNCAQLMVNLSSDAYPRLTSRRPFMKNSVSLDDNDGIGAHGKIIYYVKEGKFYYNGEEKFEVSEGRKRFCDYNGKILVFPDMMYYNPKTDKHGRFGITTEEITYTVSHRTVGTVDFGLAAIQSDDLKLTDYFKVGDGIKITDEEGLGVSGFHTITAVNKDFGVLFFDKFEFGDGEGFTVKGKISNGAPEKCDAACICGGRVWVAGGNRIQATTINDECNWAVGGDDEKSSFICDFDNQETITACIEFEGSPVFFSEKKIYKVYGDRASNFCIKCCSNWGGIPKRMSESVAVLKDKIFYVSDYGAMYFDGSTPRIVEATTFPLPDKVCAASDGRRYYAFFENGQVFYVYDEACNQWHLYGDYGLKSFLTYNGGVYADTDKGFYSLSGDTDLFNVYDVDLQYSVAADFVFEVDGKRPLSIGLDLECGEDADYEIYVSFDTEIMINPAKVISGNFSGMLEIPLVPKSCQKLNVRIYGLRNIVIKKLYVELVD